MERDQQAERARFVLQQAHAQDAKRKEAEIAEAEAKKAEEARKAEEERRIEDERKAEEARQAAEAARKAMEEEQARKAEEDRKVDEERRRKDAEMEGARDEFRRDVLAALPRTLSSFLDPDSPVCNGDNMNNGAAGHLPDHCLPLLAVDLDEAGTTWVLNVQAAPLLGSRGRELLYPQDHPLGFLRTFCKDWATKPLSGSESKIAQRLAHQIALQATPAADDAEVDEEMELDDAAIFQMEINRMTERLRKIEETKQKLLNGTVALELVRLQDVLDNLGPSLSTTAITVQHLPTSRKQKRTTPCLENGATSSFVDSLREVWERAPSAQTFVGGRQQEKRPISGRTRVMIVHEK